MPTLGLGFTPDFGGVYNRAGSPPASFGPSDPCPRSSMRRRQVQLGQPRSIRRRPVPQCEPWGRPRGSGESRRRLPMRAGQGQSRSLRVPAARKLGVRYWVVPCLPVPCLVENESTRTGRPSVFECARRLILESGPCLPPITVQFAGRYYRWRAFEGIPKVVRVTPPNLRGCRS